MSVKGLPFIGKLNEFIDKMVHATVIKAGSGRASLDVVAHGYYRYFENKAVELGSTDELVKITAHGAKEGDVMRIKTSTNYIVERDVIVDRIIDANWFKLSGYLSANLTAGDTVDMLHSVLPLMNDDGSELSSIIAPPIAFTKNGSTQTVTEDTVTPSNNAPLPVKLTGVTGDVNITAGDLNVQLSHAGANYDSTRIGDGTNLLTINTANEAKVKDTDMYDTFGAKTSTASLTDTADTGFISLFKRSLERMTTLLGMFKTEAAEGTTGMPILGSDGTDHKFLLTDATGKLQIVASSSALPTGAATETTLASVDTKFTTLNAKDFSTEVTLAAMSAKLPAALGKLNAANSLSVTLATSEDVASQTTLAALNAKIPVVGQSNNSGSIPVALASDSGLATETNLTNMSAKLPTSLGTKLENTSLSVVIANSTTKVPVSLSVASAGAVNNGTATTSPATITKPANATGFMIKNQAASAGTLYYSIGAIASAASMDLLPGQGSAFIPISADISIASDDTASYCIQWSIT